MVAGFGFVESAVGVGVCGTIQVLALLEHCRSTHEDSESTDMAQQAGNLTDSKSGKRSGKDEDSAKTTGETPDKPAAGTELSAQPRSATETHRPSIVVAPRSLIFNWIEEAGRFTPNLKVLNYTGLDRKRLVEVDR